MMTMMMINNKNCFVTSKTIMMLKYTGHPVYFYIHGVYIALKELNNHVFIELLSIMNLFHY